MSETTEELPPAAAPTTEGPEAARAPKRRASAPRPGSPADETMLRALLATTGHRRRAVDAANAAESHQTLADLRDTQAEVTLRRLRNRYATVKQSAAAMIEVVTQAVRWADRLVTIVGNGRGRRPDPIAHSALVALLARRAAVDGISVALETVHSCQQLIAADLPGSADVQTASRAEGGSSLSREELGHTVREIWIKWAREQSDPDPSWLTPWHELDEPQREAAMRIGEGIATLTRLAGSADRASAR